MFLTLVGGSRLLVAQGPEPLPPWTGSVYATDNAVFILWLSLFINFTLDDSILDDLATKTDTLNLFRGKP